MKAENRKKAMQSGVQPKKPMSAYMFYMQETSSAIRQKDNSLKLTEISK